MPRYGPDGMLIKGLEDGDEIHHGVEMGQDEGWYRAESGAAEQEVVALHNFHAICAAVEDLHEAGMCPSRRWTNDPDAFPELNLGIVPFPPNDEQLYCPRPPIPPDEMDEPTSDFPEIESDTEAPKEDQSVLHRVNFNKAAEQRAMIERPQQLRPWARLVDFGMSGTFPGSCVVFEEISEATTNCGRVYQGQLENAYFVEALNAITLRPKLARRLFHWWDVDLSVYILRIFRNGTWVRVEVDDYVPVPNAVNLGDEGAPFPCRSEHFPRVLWPSLVEKAYAKVTTLRGPGIYPTGGWEALGGGGRVEEALADLTGGVAGSFLTRDVAPDRLFVYFHELQRHCLFVCRVHLEYCAKHGIKLNPLNPYAINRAAHFEGSCFVQVFAPGSSPRSGYGNGGLSMFTVPREVEQMFPEKTKDGFFWVSIFDFHRCFEEIFECRLTNSEDVGIAMMPPSQLPNAIPGLAPPMPPGAGPRPLYFEWIHANSGIITEHRPPEFTVLLPTGHPTEVVAVVQQTDPRITQVGSTREPAVPILVKVYEHVEGETYSANLVCRSNWYGVRDAMVAFRAPRGGRFLMVVELPKDFFCERLIMRCYTSALGAQVSAGGSMRRHLLVQPSRPPLATKWTFVGCASAERMARTDRPEMADLRDDLDTLRRRELGGRCSLM